VSPRTRAGVGLKLRERPGEIDGVHRREASVDLDENIDVLADRVADRAALGRKLGLYGLEQFKPRHFAALRRLGLVSIRGPN
jgi:hypothetical protein